MKKKKELITWVIIVFLSTFFAGCLGGEEERNEISISEEAGSGFDFTQSFAKLNTKIVSFPSECSESTSAEFKFKCTGGVLPCKFKCNLDAQGWTKCKKAMTYLGLAEGEHTLQVYAIDATGKKDKTPESYSWTIASSCPICGDGICSPGENVDNCPVDCPGTEIAQQVSAGAYYTCALTLGGAVKCWGDNGYGRLGNGGISNMSNVPVNVSGLSSGVIAISAGAYHACALISGGAVKCWGYNANGQLGDGSNASFRIVPVDVVSLTSGIIDVSAGGAHTCALTSGGAVKCWGDNSYGQLGDGTTTEHNIPVDVPDLSSGIIAISAGMDYTCALTSSGTIKCWGDNYLGQLGNGTNNKSNVPVDVYGLSSEIKAISAGYYHHCALTSEGAVKCWGYNSFGQLGNGSNYDSNIPVDVLLSSGVSVISAGEQHTCAVASGGAAKCWGSNFNGKLGNGSTKDSNTPVDVYGLSSGIIGISAGWQHSCAVTFEGAVKCWGHNYYGELGDSTYNDSNVPVDVIGFGP